MGEKRYRETSECSKSSGELFFLFLLFVSFLVLDLAWCCLSWTQQAYHQIRNGQIEEEEQKRCKSTGFSIQRFWKLGDFFIFLSFFFSLNA